MDKSELMEKVIDGSASPREQKEFDSWISENEENKREFAEVKWLIENVDNTERAQDDPFYDGWKIIQRRMHAVQKRRKFFRSVKTVVGVAVALIILYFLFHQLGFLTSSARDWTVVHESLHPLVGKFPFHASYGQI